ncbi:hypothetical protein SAMN05428985_11054 [Nocardioides sp. YR527]|uniref:helix-turn-helix domain-containing protein n=1 Tax=Nocardioides sp. YR527 TaxID=1881028 RepID=UPI00088AD0A4|nr:helix-turn-helix domain-containing protein [Nocardioides sp. YR527]SDL14789.1 hypothetical protein SAMN05428985_11054 [Nocardioides sp. YR527]
MSTDRARVQPLTREEKDRILSLHGEGKTRGAIARTVGRDPASVTRVVKAAGKSFARTDEVKEAIEATKVDNAGRRAKSVQRLYTLVERLLDRLDADTYTTIGYAFGQAIKTSLNQDEVPPAELRHLTATMTNLLHSAAKLEAVDKGMGGEAAMSLLGDLFSGLQAQYGDGTDEAVEDDSESPDTE